MQESLAHIRINKIRGALISFIIHLALALLIFYFGYTTPLPLPEEEGISINFGTTETGAGIEEPAPSQAMEDAMASTNSESDEEILTQNTEEAPTIEKKNPDVKKPLTVPVTKKTNETTNQNTEEVKVVDSRKPNQKALFPGAGDANSTSNNQGITNGNGNQGKLEGVADADAYNGSGGNGVSYKLDGRKFISLPKPEYTKQTYGTVIVEITVDREGKVVAAVAGVKGSTTLDEYLINSAKRAALSSRFDANPNAPAFQKGYVTYKFLLN